MRYYHPNVKCRTCDGTGIEQVLKVCCGPNYRWADCGCDGWVVDEERLCSCVTPGRMIKVKYCTETAHAYCKKGANSLDQ